VKNALVFLAICVALLAFAACKVIVARNSTVSEDTVIDGTNRVTRIELHP